MKLRRLPIIAISSLLMMTSLTSCNKDELNNLKNNLQTQIDEIKTEIEELRNNINSLKSEMDTAIEEVKADYESKIQALNAEIDSLSLELEALKAKHEEDKIALENDYNNKMAELKAKYDASISTIEAKIIEDRASIINLTNKHNEDIAALTNDYNLKISDLETSIESTKDELNEALTSAVENLTNKHNDDVASINSQIATIQTNITTLTNKHNIDITTVTNDYLAKIAELKDSDEAKINQLKEELESELAELNKTYLASISELEAQIVSLSEEIATLTSTLASEIATVTTNYQTEIASLAESEASKRATLKKEIEAKITTLDDELNNAVKELEAGIKANTTTINSLKESYDAELKAIKDDYNAKVTALDNKYQEEVNKINKSIATIEASISILTKNMNAEIASIKNDYQSKINDLTSRVGALENKPVHTVTFEVRDEWNPANTRVAEVQEVIHGEKPTKPVEAARSGYYLTPWYVGENDDLEAWSFFGHVITEDITIYAYERAEWYYPAIDENYTGGRVYTLDSSIYTGDNYALPIPSRDDDDHTFLGYYVNDEQVTDASGNSLVPYNFGENVTFIAHWSSGEHDGLTPETAFTAHEAIAMMEYAGSGVFVNNKEYYVKGVVQTGSTVNTTYHQWTCNVDEPLGSMQFKISSAALDSSIQIDEIDGELDGKEVIVFGYMELYNGEYKIGYIPASASPTGKKYIPTIVSVKA